jgi:SNF2 family DNA or RNA helicase
MLKPYTHKTTPFSHQAQWLAKTADREFFAYFWDQGTGKSKIIVDTAAMLWEAGEIDAVLVVAPSSVHVNWVTEEIPTHLPDHVMERSRVQIYHSGGQTARRLWHQEAINNTMRHDGLSWLTISYAGFMTAAGKETVWRFLRDRRVLYVLDESMFIKSPNAKRTKSICASSKHAHYRRVLCGTPAANSPFDVYPQLKFLNENFWKHHGIDSALAFRHFFGVFAKGVSVNNRHMEWVVKYKNLDLMREWLEPISSRVMKEDVLDLPDKLYSKRHVKLTPAQRRIYDQLKDDFMVELANGELVQAIIWANWNEDINQITDLLGKRAVQFDGQITEDERQRNKEKFKAGDAQFFVSKPSVGGTGHTLTEAKTVIYYNNGYSLTNRLQSEDRAHRIGQKDNVDYVDIMGEGTIDEHVVTALRNKFDVAAQVTGDIAKEWI